MTENNQYETPRDVQQLYEHDTVPVLDALTQVAIKRFLADNNCENLGGALIFSKKSPTIHEATSMAGRYMIERQDDAFYGPYFLGDKYYKKGIGVWTMNANDSDRK